MKFLQILMLAAMLLVSAAGSAMASFDYGVTVDTASLTGTSGYLYFQLVNGDNKDTFAANAQVLNFSTDAILGAKAAGAFSGSNTYATGTLPATLTIANTNAMLNDYNQAITFGNYISFDLALATIGAPDPMSTASFSMWLAKDAAGSIPLQTADGLLFVVDVNGNGTRGLPAVYDTKTSVVPVPAAVWLLGTGLFGVVGLRRRV
jgi:hypothetical protein